MKQKAPIKIILADDHEIFRDGFNVMMKKQHEIDIVGEAANGQQLLNMVRKLQPDVVLTDIKMPLMDGVEATRMIVREFPHIGIIALSMFDDVNLIIEMLEAGAKGYLLKSAHKREIFEAIRTVYRDEVYYCNSTSHKMAMMIARSHFNPNKPKERVHFNDREIEIIKLICQEFSNKEISDSLHLSIRTIEGYREKIMEKTNARNAVGIVVYAIKNGIYKP